MVELHSSPTRWCASDRKQTKCSKQLEYPTCKVMACGSSPPPSAENVSVVLRVKRKREEDPLDALGVKYYIKHAFLKFLFI